MEQYLLQTQNECRCAEKYCQRLRIYKISEGLYRIGDRNVFIRVICSYHFINLNWTTLKIGPTLQLFKNRHVMVRVGGGWDTLEHYLLRHDPCRRGEGGHHPASGSSRSPTPENIRTRLSSANACGQSSHLGGSTPCLTNDVNHFQSINEFNPS